MLFHHLDHQAIDSTSHCRNLLQNLGTAALSLQRSLQRFDLAADAAHPGQKLGLSAYRMTHETNPKNTITDIVSEACRRVQDATLIEKQLPCGILKWFRFTLDKMDGRKPSPDRKRRR